MSTAPDETHPTDQNRARIVGWSERGRVDGEGRAHMACEAHLQDGTRLEAWRGDRDEMDEVLALDCTSVDEVYGPGTKGDFYFVAFRENAVMGTGRTLAEAVGDAQDHLESGDYVLEEFAEARAG